MNVFKLCSSCEKEYKDIHDRRFYSQTNSCADCGIKMSLFSPKTGETKTDQSEIIDHVGNELKTGKIIALKGIGGYMLIADAHNEKVIRELRFRKNRPHKPFALMVKDVDMLDRYVNYRIEQKQAFLDESAAIVLFEELNENELPFELIAPKLNEIGIMRAYTPLHYQILSNLDRAIIATSGNRSGTPIVFDDSDARENLAEIADLILTHNREIQNPQDDSVIRFTSSDRKIVIRRARGLAPNLIRKKEKNPDSILAFGAMLKSTFSVLYKHNIFVSNYIGNSNSLETQNSYSRTMNNMLDILEANPDVVLCDKHPGYFSHDLAIEFAENKEIQLEKIQHHKAHFTSVLGENDLWNEAVCGIIWDGTGLGDDYNIWGGEVFLYEKHELKHFHQFPCHSHILGDKMVNEPRISALSYFSNMERAKLILKDKFNDNEWKAYNRLIETSKLKTSSIGRLFDAVASLIGLIDTCTFHGQAAMYLEALALESIEHQIEAYPIIDLNNMLNLDLLGDAILSDLDQNTDKSTIAMAFHKSMLNYIKWIAEKSGMEKLAFSGGVFQNKLLIELVESNLGKDYELYFHQSLSPNDESISFGQLMYYLHIDR